MRKKWIKIDPILFEVFNDRAKKNFNVLEVRDIYVSLNSGRVSLKKARQRIYTLLRKMTSLGLFQKLSKDNSRQTIYSKTDLFSKLIYCSGKVYFNQSNCTNSSYTKSENDSEKLKALRERLQDLKEQMETSLAESEEYRDLHKVCPDLEKYLERKHLEAKARSIKCLGHLNAVQNVLTQIEN